MGIYSSCRALIIGVSRYADPQYDLSYARSDAEAMAELLGNEFGFDQVWTLYDNDATKANITRFFEQDLQRTDEDDGLLVFFAGHGITVTSAIGDDRGFLIPHDGDPKQAYANISLTGLRDDYLPMIPAKHVFLIVDACYGGLALRDVAAAEQPTTIDDAVLAELTRRDHKVRQVLAAGTKDQRVLDGGLFGHSVFTGRLLESLREADPYITADRVGVHVRERVARDSLDRKHRQTPQFGYLFGGEGSYVFRRPVRRLDRHLTPLEAAQKITNVEEITAATKRPTYLDAEGKIILPLNRPIAEKVWLESAQRVLSLGSSDRIHFSERIGHQCWSSVEGGGWQVNDEGSLILRLLRSRSH